MDLHGRTEPPHAAGELASLTGFLDYQRQTLEWKCSGLTTEQLRLRAVPPSGISLLGLVRHMAEVERGWFQNTMAGADVARYWGSRPDGDWADFDVDDADPAEALEVWRAACARSREVVADLGSPDATGAADDGDFSLRWVLLHMLEEYARHNGHADLLRERIDGVTGE